MVGEASGTRAGQLPGPDLMLQDIFPPETAATFPLYPQTRPLATRFPGKVLLRTLAGLPVLLEEYGT